MKSSIFSRPIVIIPVALVIAAAIAYSTLGTIGKPPVVDSALTASSSTATLNGDTVSLGFNATGRVSQIAVSVGSSVTKGEVLTTLDSTQAQGAADQAKGALDLAKAQLGSMSLQYQNAETQQDTLVNNAYRTLLSSGLQAIPIGIADETHNPTVTGTYTCGKEGTYEIDPYNSGTDSGYSFNLHGLEEGSGSVTYGTPQPLGSCGLMITFQKGFSGSAKWTVTIPNTTSANYQANKNAYDLAVSTRTQTLTQLAANLGQNGSTNADVANASITAAQGAYEAANAALANYIIVAPADGTVSYINDDLKIGQSVTAGEPVITITTH